MAHWHLQVCEREWVVWWYGPLPAGAGGHVDPAVTFVGAETQIPFELPEHRPGSQLPPPQEVRRVQCWGWRVRTNDGIHDCGWHLAESREQCIADAKAWEARNPRPGRGNGYFGTNDVRQYLTGLW